MSWQDELRAEIETFTHWAVFPHEMANGITEHLWHAAIKLPVSVKVANEFADRLGKVNSSTCAGMARGRMVLNDVGYDNVIGSFVTFIVFRDHNAEEIYGPYTQADMYQDFASINESWHDLPPML